MTRTKTVLLVAGDFAESTILQSLSRELVSRGYLIRSHLGFGQDKIEPITKEKVAGSDLVIISISGNSRDEVQAGLWAAEQGIPLVVYAGGHGSHEMLAFEPIRNQTALLLHAHACEADTAGKLFPQARVAVVGNPMWENFTTPPFGREEVRQRLGVSSNQKLIFVPGDTTPVDNFPLFGAVIEAVHREDWSSFSTHLVIGLHPGDKKCSLGIYREVAEASEVPIKFTTRETFPGSHLIPGIDLMVTAMSSLGIEAAFQRKPVINYLPPTMMRRIRATRPNFEWEPLVVGAAEVVRGDGEHSIAYLAQHMRRLLDPNGFKEMRNCQEQHYPEVPPKGTAVSLMVNTISKFFAGEKQ